MTNVSRAFMHQLITKDSLEVSNMTKARLTEFIIVKTLYMAIDITKACMAGIIIA